MTEMTTTQGVDWIAYYGVLREKLGRDKLRRIKSRLYEKLETINGEIDELEEDKELHFLPQHPEFATFIDAQVEQLLADGRAVSIQLETVIGLIEEA